MVSETKDAHSKRAFLSASPPGGASAVKVETRGRGAFYLDGASEPYNCRRKARCGISLQPPPCFGEWPQNALFKSRAPPDNSTREARVSFALLRQECSGSSSRALIERSLQDAGECLVFGLGEIIHEFQAAELAECGGSWRKGFPRCESGWPSLRPSASRNGARDESATGTAADDSGDATHTSRNPVPARLRVRAKAAVRRSGSTGRNRCAPPNLQLRPKCQRTRARSFRCSIARWRFAVVGMNRACGLSVLFQRASLARPNED
jgi:hypothetical protein